MTCITTTMTTTFLAFYISDYSPYLQQEVKIDQKYLGFIFGIVAASGCIASPIVGFISKRTPRIYLAQAALITIPISLILFGPSKLFGFPQTLALMLPGNVLLGISYALGLVPIIAEIIDAVRQKENVNNED